jgi:hypothetical protein
MKIIKKIMKSAHTLWFKLVLEGFVVCVMWFLFFAAKKLLPKKYRMRDSTLKDLLRSLTTVLENTVTATDDGLEIMMKGKSIFEHLKQIDFSLPDAQKEFQKFCDELDDDQEAHKDYYFMVLVFPKIEVYGKQEIVHKIDDAQSIIKFTFDNNGETVVFYVLKHTPTGSEIHGFDKVFTCTKGYKYKKITNLLFQITDNKLYLSAKDTEKLVVEKLEMDFNQENYIVDEKFYNELLDEITSFKSKGIQRSYILNGPPGTGKCLGKGTPVLMFNGQIKKVENIVVGDQLIGPDSKPRNVLALGCGKEQMYRIKPVKGMEWECNESHILALVCSKTTALGKANSKIEITVKDYLKLDEGVKNTLELYRVDVSNASLEVTKTMFSIEPTTVDDYYGFQIDGDGLFLLGDFTVTHNTTFCLEMSRKVSGKVLKIDSNTFNNLASSAVKTIIENLSCDFIIVDDIDRIHPSDLPAFLYMLEQIKNFSNKPTLLATVNNIKNLDQAVIRPGRFDDIIEFSPPDKLDRAEFIKKYSEKLGTPMKKTQINKLVVATDGMTQAYLKEYCLQFSIEGNVDKIIEKIKRRRVYLDLTNPESYVDNNNDDGDIEMD